METGFENIDHHTDGFQPGELITMSARPEMGATSFAITVATNVLKQRDSKVLYFSLEMGRAQLSERFLRIVGNEASRAAARFFMDDRSSISPQNISDQILKVGPNLVIIDYLQLLPSRDKEGIEYNLKEWLYELKHIAVLTGTAILVLSVLPRECEGRMNLLPKHFPIPAGLDAVDKVGFLYRVLEVKTFYNQVIVYFFLKAKKHATAETAMLQFDERTGRIFKSAC